ncbi:MAG: monovalent cation/H(+) antiporter subunit G [Micromonosporaceae bacterium]|jgi:multicomponent Na+:H+ antiporter subunit G
MGVQDAIGQVLIGLGGFLMVSAAVGMARLPDVFHRTNAVAKAAVLGLSLILIGVAVLMPTPHVVATVALAILAQLFTAPVAGYAVGRAAYRSGAPLSPDTFRNDLAPKR